MFKALLCVCVVIVVALSSVDSRQHKILNKNNKKYQKKCFQEIDAMAIVRAELDKFEEAFRKNELGDFNDISDTAVVMNHDLPTVFGKQAILGTRKRRHFARNNLGEAVKTSILKAVQISCDRIYHVETSILLRDGQEVAPGRWLVIWKKVGGRWFQDVVMDNLPE